MKIKRTARFLQAIVCVICIMLVSGCTQANIDIEGRRKKTEKKMEKGTVLVLECTKDNLSDEEYKNARASLCNILNSMGWLDYYIERAENNKNAIEIQIENITDTAELESLLEGMPKKGKLSFRDENGTEVLSGDDVERAEAMYGQTSSTGNSQNYVQLKLKPEGVEKWYNATSANVGKPIYIYLYYNEELPFEQQTVAPVSAPNVESAINSEICVITGNFTQESANLLASQINSGSFGNDFKIVSKEVIY